ncbi:hypothetical protein N0V88_002920 [Collariella sp. IMI 366227]|nr:hypothetical protein N0V88_002920 [Collariella sp. IMI 366227]
MAHLLAPALLLLTYLTTSTLAALNGHCPPSAKSSPPTQPSCHDAAKTAAAALKSIFDQLTTYNSSTVVIGVKSVHERKMLFEYYHTPANKDARVITNIAPFGDLPGYGYPKADKSKFL